MDLAGPVVIIEGRLYPVEEFEINHDTNIETLFSDPLMRNQEHAIVSENISGSIESYRFYEVPLLGTPERADMYMFSPDKGTEQRTILRDAVITGAKRNTDSMTQTIEFIAEGLDDG